MIELSFQPRSLATEIKMDSGNKRPVCPRIVQGCYVFSSPLCKTCNNKYNVNDTTTSDVDTPFRAPSSGYAIMLDF